MDSNSATTHRRPDVGRTSPSPPSPRSRDGGAIDVDDRAAAAQPMRNYDGTAMRDAGRNVVYRSQFLATHPLKSDCKERVGYAGKRFSYVSGDGVIRTMNAIFGHGGWSSQITMERNVLDEKDERGRWHVGYLASVRVTLLRSGSNGGAMEHGASHEDCGSGEGIDNSKIKAHEKAMKSAVTDAMKRAARHYGERLGNALYVKGNGIRTAPRTNRDALAELERKDALNLFGDQALLRAGCENANVRCKRSPSSAMAKSAAAAATSGKENWQQNRAVGPTEITATHSFHHRPSTNSCAVASAAQPSASSAGLKVLPSPVASAQAAPRNGAAQAHGDVINNNVSVRTRNPSPVTNNTGGNHRMHQPPNNTNRNLATNATGNPPPAPSNLYQSSNNGYSGMQQHAKDKNNNLIMSAPQPPNLMAPPRSVYNPAGGGDGVGGTAQCNGGGNRHVHPGGKRSLDGCNGGGGRNAATGYGNANNVGGDVANKRQKANPYHTRGGNARMSV